MTLVGNKMSNSIYEQLINQNNSAKISKYSERSEREFFITSKYKAKKFLEILENKKILNPKLYNLAQKILSSSVLPSKEMMAKYFLFNFFFFYLIFFFFI